MLKQKNEKLKEKVYTPQQNININCFYYEADPKMQGFLFPMHWHSNLELTYIVDGSATIECEKNISVVREGDIFLVNPSQYHACDNSTANLKLYCLIIDMDILTSKYMDYIDERYIKSVTDGLVMFNNHIQNDEIPREIMLNIYNSYQNKQNGYELDIKSELYRLLSYLFKNRIDTVRSQEQSKSLSINKSRVNMILDYIGENYMNTILIDELSKYICISKNYLCRFFCKITGKTIMDYINSFRIQRAVDLLMTSSLNVTEIASAVGFSDINYFSRIFKKYKRMAPTAIRKLNTEI